MKLTAKKIREFETATSKPDFDIQETVLQQKRPKTGASLSSSKANSNMFGMKKSKPQNTYRHDLKKLDNLIEGFNTLHLGEKAIETFELEKVQADHKLSL